jgi:RNA polymerase sigma factor (sigma-70 family)
MLENLAEQCKSGNRKAEQALFEACFPFLWTTCRVYSIDDQEAMNFLNLGFYKVLCGLPKWKKDSPFKPWAKRVTINAIIDEMRRYQKHKNITSSIHLDELQDQMPESINSFEIESACDYIIEMIRRLPTLSAHVFNLYAIEGMPYPEISQLLGITESTARWHVHESRKKLSTWIHEYQQKTI